MSHYSGKTARPAGQAEPTKTVGAKGPSAKGGSTSVQRGNTASKNVGSLGNLAVGPARPSAKGK